MSQDLTVVLGAAWLLSLPIAYFACVYIDARRGWELAPTPIWVVWPVAVAVLACILAISVVIELTKRTRELGRNHRSILDGPGGEAQSERNGGIIGWDTAAGEWYALDRGAITPEQAPAVLGIVEFFRELRVWQVEAELAKRTLELGLRHRDRDTDRRGEP